MNPNLLGIVTFAAGAVLIYAAVTNKDPRDVIKESLGQKKAQPKVDTKPNVKPNDYQPTSPYYNPSVPV